MAYLKSYRQNRETQAIAIAQSRTMLTQKVDVLNSNKKERMVTLTAQSEQLKVLQEDKKAQDKVVAQLKGQESVIAKQIKDKEKQRVRMQQAVMAIIKREIEEAARKDRIAKQKAIDDAKKNAAAVAPKNNTSDNSVKNNTAASSAKNNEPIVLAKAGSRPYSPFESTEEGRETSMHFEQNRGRLPWPVDRGNVFIEFGVSTVPGTKLTQKSDNHSANRSPTNLTRSLLPFFLVMTNGQWRYSFHHMVLTKKVPMSLIFDQIQTTLQQL
jgi:septal ring factor EnvC (AmiA/AmiB activator)